MPLRIGFPAAEWLCTVGQLSARVARRGWSEPAAASAVTRLTLLGLVASLALASGTVWLVRAELTELMLTQLSARAVEQLELGISGRLDAADFLPPHTSARAADLSVRLEPLVARLMQRSGVIRVNIVSADGTIIYSDNPSLNGKAIPLDDKPELALALAGSIGSSGQSPLTSEENADLRARYRDAFEVYVPVVLEGRIVGAYEIYQDRDRVRSLLVTIWVLLVVVPGVGLYLLALWVTTSAGRGTRPGNQPPHARWPVLSRSDVLVAPDAGGGLTPRELEVLQSMATSHSYRDIARDLLVSEETVRTHAKSVLRKLGQHDRTGAVVTAVAAGILQVQTHLAEPADEVADRPHPSG